MATPRVLTMKLSDLEAAPYNPRKIADKALAGLNESIARWGLVQPIVWNKQTKHIVGGHQRVRAMLSQGQTEALVVVVDLPEVEEKALNVTLNNPDVGGEFTLKLPALLTEIKLGIGDDDFNGLGLDGLGDSYELPEDADGKEFVESVEDDVEMIICPYCEKEFPR